MEKICKCGHKRNSHNRVLLKYLDCSECNCSDYLRKASPTKSDKIIAGILIGYIVFFWGLPVYLYSLTFDFEEIMTEQIEMTFGQLLDLVIMMFIGTALLLTALLFPFDFFYNRKRRTHPEVEK